MISLPRSRSPLSRRDALRFFGLSAAAFAMAPALARAADASPGTPTALTGPQPGFYRFNIGAFEAIAFIDGGMAGPLAQLQLWSGPGTDTIGSVLKNAYLPDDRIRIPFCVLLVRMGSELVLVDSGAGALFGPIGGALPAQLAAAGVDPAKITAVILTHAHGDHMGGLLDREKKPVFKNARHFIHRREHDFWSGASPDLSSLNMPDAERQGFIAAAQTHLAAIKFERIQAGDKLLDGLEIIDTPGHTPGHISLLFSSGNEQLLHLVDTVHHHIFSFERPDWHIAFDADPAAAAASRKRILDRASADRLRVFGGHLPFPSLGHVRIRAKESYEYVIEPWGTS